MGSGRRINPYPGRLVYAVDKNGRCVFCLPFNGGASKINAQNSQKSGSGGHAGGALQTVQRSKAGSADPL